MTERYDGGGLFCPDCFGLAAYVKGIHLRWTAEEDTALATPEETP